MSQKYYVPLKLIYENINSLNFEAKHSYVVCYSYLDVHHEENY